MFVILMATYNGENYIEEQIHSIIGQSYKDWFLLVCDDGSSDGTISILDKYAREYPDKIKVITNTSEKHGAKNNFFFLLGNAPSGDYYVFCDQDDVWSEDKLQVLSQEYKKYDASIPTLIYHNLKIVDQKLQVLSESFSQYTELELNLQEPFFDLVKYNYIPGCAMSFNNSLMKSIRLGGEGICIHDWWVILICAAIGKIYYIDKPLTLYRQHDTNTIGIMSKAHGFGLIKRYLSIEKLRKVFGMLRRGKLESYNILDELNQAYGDTLQPEIKLIVDKNLHYMTCKNKVAALAWGMKKRNRQKGLIKNIYYWMSILDQ